MVVWPLPLPRKQPMLNFAETEPFLQENKRDAKNSWFTPQAAKQRDMAYSTIEIIEIQSQSKCKLAEHRVQSLTQFERRAAPHIAPGAGGCTSWRAGFRPNHVGSSRCGTTVNTLFALPLSIAQFVPEPSWLKTEIAYTPHRSLVNLEKPQFFYIYVH